LARRVNLSRDPWRTHASGEVVTLLDAGRPIRGLRRPMATERRVLAVTMRRRALTSLMGDRLSSGHTLVIYASLSGLPNAVGHELHTGDAASWGKMQLPSWVDETPANHFLYGYLPALLVNLSPSRSLARPPRLSSACGPAAGCLGDIVHPRVDRRHGLHASG